MSSRPGSPTAPRPTRAPTRSFRCSRCWATMCLYNEGLRRAFDVITRPGSLVDPAFPAPTGWCRQHPGFEIAEAVSQALAEAVPELAGLGFENQSLLFSVTKDVRIGGVEEQLAVTDYAALGPPGRLGAKRGRRLGTARPGLRRPPALDRGVRERDRRNDRALRVRPRLGGCGPLAWRTGNSDRDQRASELEGEALRVSLGNRSRPCGLCRRRSRRPREPRAGQRWRRGNDSGARPRTAISQPVPIFASARRVAVGSATRTSAR